MFFSVFPQATVGACGALPSQRMATDKELSEFLAHVEEGGCPFHGTSSLDRLLAPVAMHLASPTGEAREGLARV